MAAAAVFFFHGSGWDDGRDGRGQSKGTELLPRLLEDSMEYCSLAWAQLQRSVANPQKFTPSP
ncbi:MAG: hypothetical protein AAF358_01720, partial [Pseudomonadota bacterium]